MTRQYILRRTAAHKETILGIIDGTIGVLLLGAIVTLVAGILYMYH